MNILKPTTNTWHHKVEIDSIPEDYNISLCTGSIMLLNIRIKAGLLYHKDMILNLHNPAWVELVDHDDEHKWVIVRI